MRDDQVSVAAPSRGGVRAAVLAVASGVVVVILVLGAQLAGLLGGGGLIVFGILAALAVPASRELSRRILLLSCFLFGWAPLMWWFPIELPGLPRLGVAVALLLGVLAGLIVGGRVLARALVPRFRVADLTTVGAGALATALAWPLLTIADGEAALRVLRIGWDYAAHFNMAEMIRRAGSLTELAAAGPFGVWSYSNYPKGFHAGVATVMEVTAGIELAGPGAELVAFAHATALVGIAAVTMVCAGVASIPYVRRRPLLATVLVVLVIVALTLGPGGGSLLLYGFPNFLLATCLLASIPLIVVTLGRIGWAWPLLALSGALVGIAHNWALLLILALAAILPGILPLRRRRWPTSAGAWTRLGLSSAATLVGGVAAWWTLQAGAPTETTLSQLIIDGGFVGGSRIEIVLPPIAAICVCLVVSWTSRRARSDGEAARTAGEVLLPIAGLGLLGFVAVVQLNANGALGYYFYKLGAGVQLASIALVAAGIAVLVRRAATVKRRRLLLAGTALVLVGLVATSSGLVNPTSEALQFRRPPGLDAQVAWRTAIDSPSPESASDAREILLAAAAVSDSAPHFWIPATLNGSTAPRLSNQWLFALTGQWAESSYTVVDEIWGDAVPIAERPDSPEDALGRIREALPDAVVVVPAELLDELRNDPAFEDGAIVSW